MAKRYNKTSVFVLAVMILLIVGCKKVEEPALPAGTDIPHITGGDGSSIRKAVVIEAEDVHLGVATEYYYLDFYACMGEDYHVETQATITGDDTKMYDKMDVACADGSEETYYFHIKILEEEQ